MSVNNCYQRIPSAFNVISWWKWGEKKNKKKLRGVGVPLFHYLLFYSILPILLFSTIQTLLLFCFIHFPSIPFIFCYSSTIPLQSFYFLTDFFHCILLFHPFHSTLLFYPILLFFYSINLIICYSISLTPLHSFSFDSFHPHFRIPLFYSVNHFSLL